MTLAPTTHWLRDALSPGNVITIITMLVSVAVFIVTTRSEVQNIKEGDLKILKERSDAHDQQIKINTGKITSLEEWKSIGPRFTATDAALLKSTAFADAVNYTNQIAGKSDARVEAASAKTDAALAAIAAKTDVNLAAMAVKIDTLTESINGLKILVAGLSASQKSRGDE